MTTVALEITLQGGNKAYGYRRFLPGDLVGGVLTVYTDGDVNCKHLFVRLFWHTAGRGSQYIEMVKEQDLFQGTLSANIPRSFNFDFLLPTQPWSYEGHYLRVLWKVQAQIDVPWGADPMTEVELVVRPLPPDSLTN
jgi:hypothetical protein